MAYHIDPKKPTAVSTFFDVANWTFRSDQERKLYLATRKPLSIELGWWLLGLSVFTAVGIAWVGISRVSSNISFYVLWIFFVTNVLKRRSKSLQEVKVIFENDRLKLVELVRWGPLLTRHLVAAISSKHIASASWGADGVLFMYRWPFGITRLFFLSYHLLGTDPAIKAFTDWCEFNRIEVEGQPPLKGGYVRPQLEARGL